MGVSFSLVCYKHLTDRRVSYSHMGSLEQKIPIVRDCEQCSSILPLPLIKEEVKEIILE